MSAPNRARLLGHNLVRLVYLDEAGADWTKPHMCVAGVLVHGDNQWPEVDRRIATLVDKHIPEPDRAGFCFHATDIYHGARYFDRNKPEWADREKRYAILFDLAEIISQMRLPVVAGSYERAMFGAGALEAPLNERFKNRLMHDLAAMDCIAWADRWLGKYAPTELATIIHEDGTEAKAMIKRTVRILRSGSEILANGFEGDMSTFGLPLKRIIDTVHFAEKAGARPLQLADLCAFVLARTMRGMHLPPGVAERVYQCLQWIRAFAPSSLLEDGS